MNLQPGMNVASFTLVRELGRGGMGCIYLAERNARKFAIKFQTYRLDPTSLLRFQREAETIARVDQHPNIARVYQLNLEGVIPYIVFEFIDGPDLEQLIKKDLLTVDQKIELTREILAGLGHIHSKGIVHRDLKPANVMLRVDDVDSDTDYQAVLVDFGLAQQFNQEHLTMTGEIMGTPAYASPEQCNGEKLTQASDVFSTGLLLFELFTGEKAVKGNSSIDCMNKILSKKYSSSTSVITDSLPPAVEQLISKCLEFNVDERFQTAGEALEFFEKALEENTKSVSSTTKTLVAMAFIGILIILISVCVWTWSETKHRTKQITIATTSLDKIYSKMLESELNTWLDSFDVNNEATKSANYSLPETSKKLIARIERIPYLRDSDEIAKKLSQIESRKAKLNQLSNLFNKHDYKAAKVEIANYKSELKSNESYKLLIAGLTEIQTPFTKKASVSSVIANQSTNNRTEPVRRILLVHALTRELLLNSASMNGKLENKTDSERKLQSLLQNPELANYFSSVVDQQLRNSIIDPEARTAAAINLTGNRSLFLSRLPKWLQKFARRCAIQDMPTDILKRLLLRAEKSIQDLPNLLFVVRGYATLNQIDKGANYQLSPDLVPQEQIDSVIIKSSIDTGESKSSKIRETLFERPLEYDWLDFCLDLLKVNRTPVFIGFHECTYQIKLKLLQKSLEPYTKDEYFTFWNLALGPDSYQITKSAVWRKAYLALTSYLDSEQSIFLTPRLRGFAHWRATVLASRTQAMTTVIKSSKFALQFGCQNPSEVFMLRSVALSRKNRFRQAKGNLKSCSTWTTALLNGTVVKSPRIKPGPGFLAPGRPATQSRVLQLECNPLFAEAAYYQQQNQFKEAEAFLDKIKEKIDLLKEQEKGISTLYITAVRQKLTCLEKTNRVHEAPAYLQSCLKRFPQKQDLIALQKQYEKK